MTNATGRFGRAGGPTPAHIREYGDVTVSSVATTANGVTNLLGAASGYTGVADSYYYIWGYSIGHTDADGDCAFGYLESDEGTPENICTFAVSKSGPQTANFFVPIKLDANAGVDIRMLADPDGNVVASVQFTVHKPT
tara:strand:+ start:4074 stop:4487 length:414 start_codon:yes stop_codon:yes gene_type:complete